MLTVPLYLDVVGIDRYGVLTICRVVLGYLGFLDLGLGPAVPQKIAAVGESNTEAAEAVFWTAMWLSLAAGLIGAILLFAGAAVYFASGEFVGGRAAPPPQPCSSSQRGAALPKAGSSRGFRSETLKKELVSSLLKFGGWVTISTAVAPLLVSVDRLAIGAYLGAAAVASYSIPFSFIARMSIIPGSLSSALFPRLAQERTRRASGSPASRFPWSQSS